MKDMMHYKGYYGTAHYSDEDKIFYGKIAFIRSLVSYEGDCVDVLRTSFEEAVDDYLEMCDRLNKRADIPFKGTFNVRVGQPLHREAVIFAQEHQINLNDLVQKSLKHYIEKDYGSH